MNFIGWTTTTTTTTLATLPIAIQPSAKRQKTSHSTKQEDPALSEEKKRKRREQKERAREKQILLHQQQIHQHQFFQAHPHMPVPSDHQQPMPLYDIQHTPTTDSSPSGNEAEMGGSHDGYDLLFPEATLDDSLLSLHFNMNALDALQHHNTTSRALPHAQWQNPAQTQMGSTFSTWMPEDPALHIVSFDSHHSH